MRPILFSLVLLGANAFFVAMEFAVVAARRTKIEELAAEGKPLAKVALSSMRELSFMLSGAQLGITMASLGLGYVAEPAVAAGIEAALSAVVTIPPNVLHSVSFVVALTIVVFLHMVIGEMAPKNIAIAEPERSVLWLAVPMRMYAGLLRPVIHVLNMTANALLRLLRVEPRDEMLVAHSAGEIARMLADSRREGLIEEFDAFLMTGVLSYRDREVGSVMVGREAVVAVDDSAGPPAVEALVNETGHTRIPVYRGDLDHVLGFVHAKDLLRVEPSDRARPISPDLIRTIPVVRETAKLGAVLGRMRRSRTHFALVVDDAATVVGIVTLEDILEELVGEIEDEHDVARAPQTRWRLRRDGRSRRYP